MEYILEKVPDYAEAKNQLEQKAQKWKQEIELKRNEITKLKENLKQKEFYLQKSLLKKKKKKLHILKLCFWNTNKKIWFYRRFDYSKSCFSKTNSRPSFYSRTRHC